MYFIGVKLSDYFQVASTYDKDTYLSKSFILPHHGVWNSNNLTTKLKVVLGDSAKSSTGNYLDNC